MICVCAARLGWGNQEGDPSWVAAQGSESTDTEDLCLYLWNRVNTHRTLGKAGPEVDKLRMDKPELTSPLGLESPHGVQQLGDCSLQE